MYLKELVISTSTNRVIREVSFKKGLNLVVGYNNDTGSSNNLGKTTLMRCINFCLGGKVSEFYTEEESGAIDVTVKDFLTKNEVKFNLSFVEDFDKPSERDFELYRQITYNPINNNPIKIVNFVQNEKMKSFEKFCLQLKIRLFNSDVTKPTFRQVIPKFVRRSDKQISNILKFLHQATSQQDYELVHFFLFGFNLPDLLSTKAVMNSEYQQATKNLKALNSIIPEGLEQRIDLLRVSVREKEGLRDSFKIDDKFEKDENELFLIQDRLNQIKDSINSVVLKKNTLIERIKAVEDSLFKDDVRTIEYMYKEAGVLDIDIQKKFKQTIEFHNSMLSKEISYLRDRVVRKDNENKALNDEYTCIASQYNNVLKKLGSMGSLREYTELNNEIERYKMDISSIETQINQLKKATKDKINAEKNLEDLSFKLEESINTFKSLNLQKFNSYFSRFSNELYKEKWFVTFSPNEERTLFKFNIDSLTQNTGSGKKQMLVASFDIAYMAYIQDKDIKLPYPRFATQDKVEIIDISYLEKLYEMVFTVNGQLILPIIEDKFDSFTNPEIKDAIIVELHQNDKFFRIEEFSSNSTKV